MADDPLDQLRASLAEARAIYDGKAETPDGETGPIAGAVNAVDAVLSFLRASPIDSQDLDPLLIIEAAFRDHSFGKRHPLFALKKRVGEKGNIKSPGQRLPSQVWVWRATVAAAVNLRMLAGDSKKAAVSAVADAIDAKPGEVDGWHREISIERMADQGAVTIYKSTISKALEVHPDSPQLAAQQLIAALPRLKL